MSTRRAAARTTPPTSPASPIRAFTLIELMVVIAIIAILSTIGLLVGNRVSQNSRVDLTKTLLRVLDNTQSTYHSDRDASVPWKYTDESVQHNEFAIADGRLNPTTDQGVAGERAEPTVTFYLLATQESPSVASAVGGINSKFVTQANIVTNPASTDPNNFAVGIGTRAPVAPQSATAAQPVKGLVVKDPWGNAIRFVHPKFQGGYGEFYTAANPPARGQTRDNFNSDNRLKLHQNGADVSIANFRRSYRPFDAVNRPTDTGDADEGLCSGSTGYFYSPGPDKDAGTRADNVYINTPAFPKETAQYQ